MHSIARNEVGLSNLVAEPSVASDALADLIRDTMPELGTGQRLTCALSFDKIVDHNPAP